MFQGLLQTLQRGKVSGLFLSRWKAFSLAGLSWTAGPWEFTHFGQQLFYLHRHGVKHPVLGGVVEQGGGVWPWGGETQDGEQLDNLKLFASTVVYWWYFNNTMFVLTSFSEYYIWRTLRVSTDSLHCSQQLPSCSKHFPPGMSPLHIQSPSLRQPCL